MKSRNILGFVFLLASLHLGVTGKDLLPSEENELFDWPIDKKTITYVSDGTQYEYFKEVDIKKFTLCNFYRNWEEKDSDSQRTICYPSEDFLAGFELPAERFTIIVKGVVKKNYDMVLIKEVYNEKDESEKIVYEVFFCDNESMLFKISSKGRENELAKKAFGECVADICSILYDNQLRFMKKLADDQKILLDECGSSDWPYKMITDKSSGLSFQYFKKKYSESNAINKWPCTFPYQTLKHPQFEDYFLSESFYIKCKSICFGCNINMIWRLTFDNGKDGSKKIQYWGWYPEPSFSGKLTPIFLPCIQENAKKAFELGFLSIAEAELENKQN